MARTLHNSQAIWASYCHPKLQPQRSNETYPNMVTFGRGLLFVMVSLPFVSRRSGLLAPRVSARVRSAPTPA